MMRATYGDDEGYGSAYVRTYVHTYVRTYVRTFPSRRAGGDPLWGATEAYSGWEVVGWLRNRIEWEIRGDAKWGTYVRTYVRT